jgi:hypothetical protein
MPSNSENLEQYLSPDSFVDRVVLAVSANEGSLTAVNPNDAGAGISIGIRQWNQKYGELPSLFRAWYHHNPSKFDKLFGADAADLINEDWLRKKDLSGDKTIMERIAAALADGEYQQIQIRLAREFVRSSITFGTKYGFETELGLALIADLINQKGRRGTEILLQQCGVLPAPKLEREKDTIEEISAKSNRAGATNRLARLKQRFSTEPADPT